MWNCVPCSLELVDDGIEAEEVGAWTNVENDNDLAIRLEVIAREKLKEPLREEMNEREKD